MFRLFVFCLGVVSTCGLLAISAVGQTTFPGTGTGAIPDGDCGGAGLQVSFAVTGITAPVTNVKLTMSGTHTWIGDLDVLLIGPGGSPQHFVFTFTGNDSDPDFGDSSDLGGPYNFFDAAPNSWWAAAAAAGSASAVPSGDYRTSDINGANTLMNAVFASVANPNGTWILKVNDCAQFDTGSITSASLTITGATAPPTDAPIDMNGDGKTDYVVVRNTGGGAGGQITWFVQNNATGAMTSQPWGIQGDRFLPSDYDGDGKDDIAIYRPGAQGAFYIINSGTNSLRVSNCGLTGDDPTVVGDYNGDGKDDIAVYRPGASAGAPSTFYWRPNDTVDFTAVVHGQNGDFVAPGDYDGDGKLDFAVQRNAGGGNANFIIKFAAGGSDQTIQFGTPTDFVVPGDYDGDGKTDIATVRGNGGFIQWQYRRSIDGATVVDTWGISATDLVAQGDYNGDGKTDYAVWRPGATPGAQSEFFVMTPVTRQISSRQWGLNADYPVANEFRH